MSLMEEDFPSEVQLEQEMRSAMSHREGSPRAINSLVCATCALGLALRLIDHSEAELVACTCLALLLAAGGWLDEWQTRRRLTQINLAMMKFRDPVGFRDPTTFQKRDDARRALGWSGSRLTARVIWVSPHDDFTANKGTFSFGTEGAVIDFEFDGAGVRSLAVTAAGLARALDMLTVTRPAGKDHSA